MVVSAAHNCAARKIRRQLLGLGAPSRHVLRNFGTHRILGRRCLLAKLLRPC
jgi:hypothetical protein